MKIIIPINPILLEISQKSKNKNRGNKSKSEKQNWKVKMKGKKMGEERKVRMKSKQDYGTHIEEFVEEFPCSVSLEENMVKIEFENGIIKIEESKITQERGENRILIEPGKTTECDYETEHGMFVLDIRGLEVETFLSLKESNLLARAKYEILIVGVEPYTNEIEISIV